MPGQIPDGWKKVGQTTASRKIYHSGDGYHIVVFNDGFQKDIVRNILSVVYPTKEALEQEVRPAPVQWYSGS